MDLYSIHLFAGAGGGLLADKITGHTPICAVEIEDDPRRVLLQRQLDGLLPGFPIWDDVRTFSADNPDTAGFFRRARGIRDRIVIAGGFPCQDISVAGKGDGIEGKKSGLWSEFARIVREIRPRFVFVENAAVLTSRGLGVVLGDLATLGYDARWGVFSACAVGAPHTRERLFILADANSRYGKTRVGHRHKQKSQGTTGSRGQVRRDWMESVTRNAGSGNGLARRVDRLKALGNGQVPQCAAEAWRRLLNDR